MDRLNQLRRDSNKSSNSSILDSSLESNEGSGFETANESSGSKYFSFLEDDPSLQDSHLKDVSLVEGEINDNISTGSQQLLDSANAASMLAQLSPVNKSKDSMDNFKIDSHIDAANILSGGVDIFDDNDNSGDENDLVIDDNASSLDNEEECTSISEGNNPILLHTEKADVINNDKNCDEEVPKQKSNSSTEKDTVATGEHVDSVNPTLKITTFDDNSSQDHNDQITNSAKSVNHSEAVTQQISTKVAKPDVDSIANLGNNKSHNIVNDNIKAAVLQEDIQPSIQINISEVEKKTGDGGENASELNCGDVCEIKVIAVQQTSAFVSESTLQNELSGDFVHFKPSIVVAKQLENANCANFENSQVEQCSTPNGDNCTPAPAVKQETGTGSDVLSSLTQNAKSINVVVPPPPQHSDIENTMAPVAKHNTDASIVVLSTTQLKKTVDDEPSLNASLHNENKNIQIAMSQADSYIVKNILISAEGQNADTSHVCNSALSADLNILDAVDTTATSTLQKVDAKHIPVPTLQKKCALSDEAMPYKKNTTTKLDTVNIFEMPNASNIATSISLNMASSTAQQNAEDTGSVPPIPPHSVDNSSLAPKVQNNTKIDNIVECPVKQNNVETTTLVPAVQRKAISEIHEASSPPKKLVEPSAQQNNNSVKAENIVEAVVDNPANDEVGGVEEPPNVLLQIDGRDVVAVDVGNNLYLYRKETDDEVTAIQIVPVENEQLQCKFLNVRHNEEGNFEVYEEHIIDVPSDADKSNDLESTTKLESHGIFKTDNVKNLENKPSHLPKKDHNKVINIQEVSYSGKGLVHNVSSSAVQPDKPVTSQGPSKNNDSVLNNIEHKIDKADVLQQHVIKDKPNKKIEEAIPGPSGISKELLKKSPNLIFSSTPKAELTMKKDVAKSDVLITGAPPIVNPIPNLMKMIDTSTGSENPLNKPASVSTLPIPSNVILEKDQPMMRQSFDLKIKSQKPSDVKLQNPHINKFGSMSIQVNSNSKHNPTEGEKKEECKVKPCKLLDQNKVCIIKPVEQLNFNVKHKTSPISQNPSFKSSKFVDKSHQLNSKLSELVEKPKIFNFKQDLQLDKLSNTPLILDNHHSNLKSSDLLGKQHTTKIKSNVQLVKPPCNLKATIPLDLQRQSIKSYVSLDNPSIKPYVPLAKHRKGNLKTLRPVEKLQNVNFKSADKSFNPNLKPGKPQTPPQKPYVILGKQSNSKVKHVEEPGKSQSIDVSNASLEKQSNSSVKSNLPMDMPRTSRLSMESVSQIKQHNAQVGLFTPENPRIKRIGHQDQMHTVINMSTTSANIPVPLRFVIEPSKKKEITAIAHREPEMKASIARQPSGMLKSMDLANNVYNDTYISEALNVKIQPDSCKEMHNLVWSEKQIKNISKKDETMKQHLPKKSTNNILMDHVSVSVSVLPAQPRTNREYAVINNQNFSLPMKGKEVLQKFGCDTTVTAVPVLPLNAKSHSTKEVCKDKEQTDIVIVNLSESSIDGYSEEEISECQPVTGDVDWEAREKALTDKRDSEYIENVLHTIEESISKMDEDKPQPSSDTANTILLNTALHNRKTHPPKDDSILPNDHSSPSKQLNKKVVKDSKSVITEVDFDKFVRRNSHHAPEDRITLQLPVHDAAAHQTKTLPGPCETKSNVNLDKGSITHNLNANKSNVTSNNNSHIPTKVYPSKTVPVPNATSKYKRMSDKYISSESYHIASGKSNVDSIHPSSYLAGVQKVNESFKFKRAYQSALESLQTKDNAEPTTSNLRVNDKPVTVVILDPESAAIVPDKAVKGLTLMAHSTSPLVAIDNAKIEVSSIGSGVALKKNVEGQNSIAHTTSPILAVNSGIVGPKSVAPCNISVVTVNHSTTVNNLNTATTSPSSSESVNNSSMDEKSIHTMQKSKYKHPRKQILTSVERKDMEIVFPNLSEVDSRSNNVNLLAKGCKRKVEVTSYIDVSKRNSSLPYREMSNSEVKPASSNKKIIAKQSPTSDLQANHHSKNPISNMSKTIFDQLVTQDKDGAKDKELAKDLSKYTTQGKKDEYVAEYNKPTQDRNKIEETKDATKERVMPEIMKVGKQVSESYEMKKARGRPRKSIIPIITSSDTQSGTKTSPIKINDFDFPVHCLSLDSNPDYSSDEDQVIVNWTMGKIDEKIVCPICSKLFRSENVVFKHVKHCSGPDNVVSPDRKSPSFSEFIVEEQPASTPRKRPRGRPSHKKIAKDTDVVETVCSAEPTISDNNKNTALNNSSVEILDSRANLTIMHTPKTVTKINVKSQVVPITNEKSETSSENNILKSKNIKTTGKVSLKCDTLTPLSRLAKVMKVAVQTNPCYSCETCGKSFRQLSYLANHRRAHHQSQIRLHTKHRVPAPLASQETSALSCEVCKKKFRKLHHLVEHREIHKCSAIPPSCEESNRKVTESKTALPTVVSEQEVSKLAPVTGFRCEACDKSFRKLYHLVEHRETHDTRARQSALPVGHPVAPKTHSTNLVPNSAPLVSLSAPVVSHTVPLVHHPAPHVSHAPLVPHIAPSVLKAVPHTTQPVSLPGPSLPQPGPSVPSVLRYPTSSDHLSTPTVPSCEICGKSFRKLHHLIEHRDTHMVSKEIPEPKIETSIPNVKSTLLAKDIIHECPLCYMVFPNEPSLNKHSTLCQRKKRSQSSNQLGDPTIDAVSQESQSVNKLMEVVTDAPSKIIPVTRPLETSPVQLYTNEKEKGQESNTENKITSIDSEMSANILTAPLTLSKEESTESDDSEIIFNISQTDCEIRYMINPLFENGSKRVPTKRASVQGDITTDRMNQLYRNVSRRTSVPNKLTDLRNIQHSPSKKSKRMTTQSHIKLTTSKTNRRLVNEPVKNKKAQSDDDEDDNNILYSFPNRRTSRASTSTTLSETNTLNTKEITIPNVNKSSRSSNQTLGSKKATQKSSEKRKSLVSIAKRKNAVLQKTLSKANLRRCRHNDTDRAGLTDERDNRKRPAPLRHLCDCGELFSSATLLARHTSMAHTPPRIRRPRDAPPPTAHQGVPIPHKMRKAVSGMQF